MNRTQQRLYAGKIPAHSLGTALEAYEQVGFNTLGLDLRVLALLDHCMFPLAAHRIQTQVKKPQLRPGYLQSRLDLLCSRGEVALEHHPESENDFYAITLKGAKRISAYQVDVATIDTGNQINMSDLVEAL
jgi:hypothetical protein